MEAPYGRKGSIDLFLAEAESMKKESLRIVEIGTIRGEGEAQSNGWSTVAFALFSERIKNCFVDSVDLSIAACELSRTVLNRYDIGKFVNIVCEDAMTWITKQSDNSIDVLYIDGWDYHSGIEKISENQTLLFTELALTKIAETSIVVFDDNYSDDFDGKGKLAIPFLLNRGWKLKTIIDNQVILIKNGSRNSFM